MVTSDPIADLLTRIRNGCKARLEKIDVPASRIKASIVRVLRDQGYVKSFKLLQEDNRAWINIQLKYDSKGNSVIQGIRRVSKPGIRRYVSYKDVGRVRNGIGIAILSTSKGIVTSHHARKERVGGEHLCEVW